MKSLVITVVLFLSLSLDVVAVEPQATEVQPATPPRPVAKQPPVEDDAPRPAEPQQPGASETEKPQWPRPYRPSEEISADSIVPFPADI